MNKTKNPKTIVQYDETSEDMPFVPPETHYLSERYIIKIPYSHISSEKGWDLRKHVLKTLEGHLGDEVELTSVKLHKPHLVSKSVARIKHSEPYARAYVTVKF